VIENEKSQSAGDRDFSSPRHRFPSLVFSEIIQYLVTVMHIISVNASVAVGDSQGFQEVSRPVSWERTILRARD